MTHGPFVKLLVEGARERAAELGYGLEDIHTGGNQAGKLTRLLLARGVVGVVIAPLYHAVGHMSLDWGRFAVVAFGNSMVRPSVHRLTHHHMHGMQTVLRVCRKKGFRRIGLALSLDSDARSDRAWSSGYLGTQVTWAPSEQVAPLLVPLSEFTSKRIDEWIKKERPDIVVIHATGCISAECLTKQSVPFVVLDREPHDTLAGMNQQFRLAGRLIIDALSAQIVHNQRGLPATPIVSMIEGLWEDHPSLSKD